MIAPWLKQHLIDIGVWNGDGISRTAKVRRHACGRYVIAGLDDPRCAGPAITDPDPLSAAGEALAVLTGRTTYNLVRTGTLVELDHRNAIIIAGSPPGSRGHDVVATHVCDAPPLPTMPTAYTITATKEATDEPPY